jgi:septum site-determining protein MinC
VEPLLIKGLNNTLILIFNKDHSCEEYSQYLQERLQSNPRLFRGSPVLFKGPGLQNLTFHDISKLQRICLEHGMILDNVRNSPATPVQRDVFLRRHIRSGQTVHADGSVVVWGDVHEGAELYAGLDIIVLGKLAGMAHAGCFGNTAGIIFTLELATRHIRVAQLTAACDKPAAAPGPMVAYIEQGAIQTRSYRTKEQLQLSFKPNIRL